MKTILRFIASSLFLALMVVVGNVTISYAEDTNTNTTTQVEETAATQDVSAEQTNTLANAEVKNGWSYDYDKGQWLYYQNNKLFTGWITENEWQEKGHYYVDNGVKVEDAFKTIGNDRYHFDYNGKVSTGLFTFWDDSKNTDITYFTDADGKLFKEGFKTIDNDKYYFENYVLVTDGIKTIGNDRYHFDYNGKLSTGLFSIWDDTKDISVYYFADTNGKLFKEGFKTIDNDKYYFENYVAVTDGTRTIDGSTYTFDSNGLVIGFYDTKIEGTDNYIENQTSRTGSLLTGMQIVNGEHQYYNADHTRFKSGWIKDNGHWYYFENYFADIGKQTINGKQYYFDYDAKMLTGWIKEPYGNWYYGDASGALITGKFTTINGVKYGFDNNSNWCADGVFVIGKNKYGFDKNGKVKTGWYLDEYGNWYYLNKQGIALTGWQYLGGKWYYFDKDEKNMYTGSHELPDHTINIFNSNGVWVKINKQGWLEVDGYWFYIDKNLQPIVGEHIIDGHTYYFKEDEDDDVGIGIGTMYADAVYHVFDDEGNDVIDRIYYDKNGNRVSKIGAGWHLFGGEWYYYDDVNKLHDGLLQYNGDTYYIYRGLMARDNNWPVLSNKNKVSYFFDSNGKKVKSGWYEIQGEWIYTDGSKNGQLATGWKTINGVTYYFGEVAGEMYSDGIIWVSGKDENRNGIYYFDKNGKVIKNVWGKLYGTWYYFGDDGKAYENKWLNYKGKRYYFNWDCQMVTGYYNTWNENTHKTIAYKFDENGALLTGWEKIDNKWYYFDSNSNYATGLKKIGNTCYYFNELGKMMTGWQLVDGKYYYFDNSGAMVTNKWVGNYYLTGDGSMAKNTWIGKYHVDANGKWDKTK